MELLPNNEPSQAVPPPITGPQLVDATKRPKYEGDGLDLSDVANAERLVRRHGSKIRYCPQWSRWLIWDGYRWMKDEAGKIIELAKETAQQIRYTAANISDPERSKSWYAFALKSQNRDRISAMITLAQSIPAVVVHSDQWDTDPELLNCLSGVVDLRTAKLHPHDPKLHITKLAPVKYDPKLKPEHWLEFLELAMQRGDKTKQKEIIDYLQRCFGYTLTGRTDETSVFIPFGSGNNGKSIFTWVVDQVMGDYACSAEPETLMARNRSGNGPSGDIARLKGARMVRAAEAEAGHRLNESMIKRMTGGERIVASFKYGHEFEFLPTCKIWMATNYKPIVRGTDTGIWRRLKLISFRVDIPATAKAKGLPPKSRETVYAELLPELPGILAWAVEGARSWHQSGLQEPPEVTNATREYQDEMDPLANFLRERCVIAEDRRVGTTSFYSAYKNWCKENGENEPNSRRVGTSMEEKGFERKKAPKGGCMEYRGVALASRAAEAHLTSDDDDEVPFK